jgi:hypothetical protein
MGTFRAVIPVDSEPLCRDPPLRDRPEQSMLNKRRDLGPRVGSAPAQAACYGVIGSDSTVFDRADHWEKRGLRALAKAIERVARPVAYPAIIAGVLIAFLTLAFLAARLVTALFDCTSLGVFLAAWSLTSGVGVLLVRRLPLLLGQSIAGTKSWAASAADGSRH